MGGAITFLTLFQQIYTILVGVILSQPCTKSVTNKGDETLGFDHLVYFIKYVLRVNMSF